MSDAGTTDGVGKNLIPIINKLQDVFTNVGIESKLDLPQIVVVGSQSSGKSSVLESIVGTDFLPRGSGIVTRRPLVLQLHKTREGPPYAEFLHKPGHKFYDFTKVREEIQRETNAVAGANKAISDKEINLKIFSPHVLDLTLVDLPGVTKVKVGDQPDDIEKIIKNLVLQYITKPNSIILAVTPANQDLANSDALKLAREVDPQGDRTLGVLTKLDLMDKGTNCLDVLTGKVIPLKRGYIGVVNRSQQDIDTNKDIQDAMEAEKEFIREHPQYRQIADQMGTRYLSTQLNHILLGHIRTKIPEIKTRIAEMIAQTNQVLTQLGGNDENEHGGALLLKFLGNYNRAVHAMIEGNHKDIPKTELFGGARINHVFHTAFSPHMMKLTAADGLSDDNIRLALANSKGLRASLFIPEPAFEMLMKNCCIRLEDPCLRCCDYILEELMKICAFCEKELQRFPNLRGETHDFIILMLQQYMAPLREFILNTIRVEQDYINTNHPQFFGGGAIFDKLIPGGPAAPPQQIPLPTAPAGQPGQAIPPHPAYMPQQQQQLQQLPVVQSPPSVPFDQMPLTLHLGTSSERDKQEVQVIKQLMGGYFDIIKVAVMDKTIKSIMHFLVNKLKSQLYNELIARFYKEDLFETLLQESDEVARQRKAAKNMLKCLLEAQNVLTEVRDYRLH